MKYFLMLLFSLVISSCGSSSNSNNENGQELQVKLILRDTFNQESNSFIQGENIEFFLVVTNNSTGAITLNFNSGKQYDFYINSLANTEIWRWSVDKAFADGLTNLVIQAGESIEVSEIWDQALEGGNSISIGSYSAFGSLLKQSQEVQFDFTIQ